MAQFINDILADGKLSVNVTAQAVYAALRRSGRVAQAEQFMQTLDKSEDGESFLKRCRGYLRSAGYSDRSAATPPTTRKKKSVKRR